MSKKQKLELTWIGKDKRPRLEPRILLEDKALSYRGEQTADGNGLHDNMLIHGDNLLALKALEQQYAGKVKCVFIDPPYNTGSAFTYYSTKNLASHIAQVIVGARRFQFQFECIA